MNSSFIAVYKSLIILFNPTVSTKGGDILKVDQEQEICITISHTVWLLISEKNHRLQNCGENNF